MSVFRSLLGCLLFSCLFSCAGGSSEGDSRLISSDSLPAEPLVEDLIGTHTGKVVKVCDGDTYDILLEGERAPRRVRMSAIDAPEHGQAFSRRSRQFLDSLIWKKEVRIEVLSKDSYGRLLALTYLPDGREMSHEMVSSGFAWHYKHYDRNVEFDSLESQARRLRLGLWSDDYPVAPWMEKALRKKGFKSVEIRELKQKGMIEDMEAVRRIEKACD